MPHRVAVTVMNGIFHDYRLQYWSRWKDEDLVMKPGSDPAAAMSAVRELRTPCLDWERRSESISNPVGKRVPWPHAVSYL